MLSVFTRTRDIISPVSGRITPFEDVPYYRAAKERGLMGVAVIPSETGIFAPIDGVVGTKAGSSPNAEIFVNPLRGTISLHGGFTSCIKKGSRVRAGDLIATIDLDFLQTNGLFTYVLLLMPRTAAKVVDNEWVKGGSSIVMKTR